MGPAHSPRNSRITSEECAASVLRLAVVGSAGAAAWQAWRHYSQLNTLLYTKLGVAESAARLVDAVAAVGLVCTVLLVVLPRISQRVVATSLFWAGVWFLLQAIASSMLGGRPLPELAPLAHAARFVAPLALVALLARHHRAARLALRLAACATFAAHGIEALARVPEFLDLVLLTALRFEVTLTEGQAGSLLGVIGAMDLGLAALLLFWPRRLIAGYMAAWAGIALLSRVTAGGPEFSPEALLRFGNAAVPCALFLLWSGRTAR